MSQNSRPVVSHPNAAAFVPRRDYATAVLALLISPLLLLGTIWSSKSERYRQYLLTLLFIAYGLSLNVTGDAVTHLARVEHHFAYMSFEQFVRELFLVLTFQQTAGDSRDVYNHIISYFFGGVLQQPNLYMAFVCGIYGYFYAGSVVRVTRYVKLSELNLVLIGFLAFFLFTKGPEGVTTVRTWTGLWVLVYACLNYYETKKLRYLVLMAMPPFIHFGWWLMIIPAIVVLLFGARPILYTSVFAASLLTAFIPAEPVLNLLAGTERGALSVNAYFRDEDRRSIGQASALFEERRQTTIWYNAYRQSGMQRWAVVPFIMALYFAGVFERIMTVFQRRIYSIGILMLAQSNLFWFLFAVHNRMFIAGAVFLWAGFLLARTTPGTREQFRNLIPLYQWGLLVTLLLFFPFVLFHLSGFADSLSVFMLGLPWLPLFVDDINMSMKEFLNILLGR